MFRGPYFARLQLEISKRRLGACPLVRRTCPDDDMAGRFLGGSQQSGIFRGQAAEHRTALVQPAEAGDQTPVRLIENASIEIVENLIPPQLWPVTGKLPQWITERPQ